MPNRGTLLTALVACLAASPSAAQRDLADRARLRARRAGSCSPRIAAIRRAPRSPKGNVTPTRAFRRSRRAAKRARATRSFRRATPLLAASRFRRRPRIRIPPGAFAIARSPRAPIAPTFARRWRQRMGRAPPRARSRRSRLRHGRRDHANRARVGWLAAADVPAAAGRRRRGSRRRTRSSRSRGWRPPRRASFCRSRSRRRCRGRARTRRARRASCATRPTLKHLAGDANDNVKEAGIDALSSVAGHAGDDEYPRGARRDRLSGRARRGARAQRIAAER